MILKMNRLIDAITGPSKKTSSMRVATAYVVFVVLTTWSYTCVKKGDLVPMDESLVALVLGSLAAKAYQRKVETQSPKDPQ